MLQSIANRELPPDIGLVIFDECHSSLYFKAAKRIIDHYSGGLLFQSKCFFLGLTASPWRTKSKQGYCWLFGEEGLVRAPDPRELIKMGYLARARHFGYGGLIDYTQLDTGSSGDYTEKSMQRVCDAEFNAQVVERFQTFCPDRKAIAFCAGVGQAWNLAAQFNKVGIVSEVVVGNTSEQDREAIYNRLRLGQTQLISSVGCLCEGFDEPSVEAALIARPTRSKALLIQMIGRALRLHPGKEDAYLMDFCENFKRLKVLATSKIQISLCPREWQEPEALKECPVCHTMVLEIARVCPECGFVFEGGDKKKEPEAEELPFGEILSPEEKEQCTYLRSQRKRFFSSGSNPAKPTWNFYLRYNYFPPSGWYKHACLRDEHKLPEVAKHIFLGYLHKVRPNAPKIWLKEQYSLEFGSYPYGSLYVSWWERLGVAATATWEEVISRYREIYSLYENSEATTEQFELLGMAFDDAREQLS